MKKWLLVLSLASLFAMCGKAQTYCRWQGISGSGDFNEPSNWKDVSYNALGRVPGITDYPLIKNQGNQNWVITFSGDATNESVSFTSPLPTYETLLVLNQHTWTLTNSLGSPGGGYGGKITLTNGTLRAKSFDFNTSPLGVSTNLVLAVKDVVCEMGTATYGATRATFEGGTLRVTNSLSVGTKSYGVATVLFDKGVKVSVTNSLWVGDAAGATGELVNVNGQLEQTGADGTFVIGNAGCGALTILGGSTCIQQTPYISSVSNKTGVGLLTVSGGSNTFGKAAGKLLSVGSVGKGSVLAYGGTNYSNGLSLGQYAGGYGEMLLTNGVWYLAAYSWIGHSGKGVVTITGGQMLSGPGFCLGRGTGTGVVTIAGGTLDVSSELRVGGNATSVGCVTLTGVGILKVDFISEYTNTANSALLFDGGTLQARQDGALIRSIDDIRLTANGLVLDTAGHNVIITGLLQNAEGQAGSLTKKGTGTLTLAGTRAASGSVSVLIGTLVMSDDVAVSAGTSRIDGSLTLAADNRLIVGTGAALTGTGSVARVTLQNNAVFARAKADNAMTPLAVSDCTATGQLTVALTGYTLDELKMTMPLIRMPTASIDTGKVTVTLNGQANTFLRTKYVAGDGQQTLSVFYSAGTMITVK